MIITDIEQVRVVSKETTLMECKKLDIFNKMEEALKNHRGIGLSAIQIGIPIRAAIIKTKGLNARFFNPVVLESHDPYVYEGEGCLSVPKRYFKTKRYRDVTAQWTNEQGETLKFTLVDLQAVVFQHEVDHMNGILCFDRAIQPMNKEGEKVGRNEKCPCGSGKKFKKCCLE